MPEIKRLLKVFLCHASQDKPIVRELYQRLKAERWIDTWLDEKKLLPGQDWRLNIEEAVETSDIVIICLSSNSVSKEGFIQKEMRYAREIALEKLEGSIFLIPLRIDECDVPRGLRFYQWADYFGEKKNETYTALLESLKLRYEQNSKIDKEEYARKEKEEIEREAAEIVVREKTEKEKAKREFVEKSKREKSEDGTVRKAELEKPTSKSFATPNSSPTNVMTFFRTAGVIGIIFICLWFGSLAISQISQFFASTKTATPSATITPTGTPLQKQITEKIDTIYSYKAHGTGKFTDDKGKIVTIQFEDEFVRPNKLHSIETSEDGQITETIFVGNPYCSRQGDGAWSCNTGFISDEIQEWAEIVSGERSFGLNTITVVDKGTRTETWNGKECILFYKTQTYTDSNSEETFELCVDSNTLLPVKYVYKGNWPDNPGTKIAYREYNLYDINVPIDISLPVSP